MKTLMHFIKTTITGGLLFLIPLVLIVIVVTKAFNLLRPLLERGVARLQIETIMGVAVLTMLTTLLLVLICFAAGLLIHFDKMRSIKKMMEDLILKFVPGFKYVKAIAGDQPAAAADAFLAILLQDGDAWVIAFIVEQNPNGYTTVFIPESPMGNSGNSKMLRTSSLCYYDLSVKEALSCLRRYGAGALELLGRRQNLQNQETHRPITN